MDYKALRGDPSDRIPGVAGIGDKTARELLGKFSTLEGVYNNLDSLRPTLSEKLRAGKETALLSQKLAKIVDQAPIELDLEKCRFRVVDRAAAAKVLGGMGFKSLVKRLTGEGAGGAKKEEVNPNQIKLL